MKQSKVRKKIIIVADDFTGATDTGVQFRKTGLKVNVIIDSHRLSEDLENSDVLVIDLESRFDTVEIAYQKCYELGLKILTLGDYYLYKKLDSTFRGNIGAEIDGLMDSMKIRMAILAPAWPLNGRTTLKGEVLLNGVRLAETEVSADPRSPVKNSRISEIIGLQSKRICSEITTQKLSDRKTNYNDLLSNERERGSEVLIFDSQEENDLKNIASLIESSSYPLLIVGSAGLASHLPGIFSDQRKQLCFVFSGSVSERTMKQLGYALRKGKPGLYLIDEFTLLSDNFSSSQIVSSIVSDIEQGVNQFIFTSSLSQENVTKVFELASEKGLSKDTAAEMVSLFMGKLAADLIERFRPSGVLLTGGDIAIKSVRALNATGIKIDREIVPGIPSGRLSGSNQESIILTKSGGFGTDDAIFKTFGYFNS
jgi:D-threonate/D-erythronate kinase